MRSAAAAFARPLAPISGRLGTQIVGVERTLVAGHRGVPSSVSEVVPGSR
jgi:hypothetical protein